MSTADDIKRLAVDDLRGLRRQVGGRRRRLQAVPRSEGNEASPRTHQGKRRKSSMTHHDLERIDRRVEFDRKAGIWLQRIYAWAGMTLVILLLGELL
jgi:hypothetical protein